MCQWWLSWSQLLWLLLLLWQMLVARDIVLPCWAVCFQPASLHLNFSICVLFSSHCSPLRCSSKSFTIFLSLVCFFCLWYLFFFSNVVECLGFLRSSSCYEHCAYKKGIHFFTFLLHSLLFIRTLQAFLRFAESPNQLWPVLGAVLHLPTSCPVCKSIIKLFLY